MALTARKTILFMPELAKWFSTVAGPWVHVICWPTGPILSYLYCIMRRIHYLHIMFHFSIGFPYFSECLPQGNLLLNSKIFCFDTAYSAPSAQVALAQDEKGAAPELHLVPSRDALLF